jgi:glycosyltransferase involved in cell wall biosynthesis
MERYIGKCLDSLLIPEIDAVEVLVVNDGSKDRSSEIAHGYADRYPQSIKVIDKANGNYGSCINVALPIATGRYVKVLDADDTFDTTAFSEFVRLLPSLSDDVLITPFCIVNEAGEVTRSRSYEKEFTLNRTYSFAELFGDNHNKNLNLLMHSLTYKLDVFSRFTYYQTEGISFTDNEWAMWPLVYSSTLRFVAVKPLYKYLIGREGQTMDPKRLSKQISDYVLLFRNEGKDLKRYSINTEAKDVALRLIMTQHNNVYLWSRNGKITEAAEQILIDYDRSLRLESPELYDALNKQNYHKASNFKYIKKWRELGYPKTVAIPLWDRIKISLNTRFGLFG